MGFCNYRLGGHSLVQLHKQSFMRHVDKLPCGTRTVRLLVEERRQAMKLIYRAKWIIVALFAITFFFSFAVLFAGGTTKINWCLLVANILLIFTQTANVVFALRNKYKEVGTTLLVILFINIALMWYLYIMSWNYTVKAVTIGFE